MSETERIDRIKRQASLVLRAAEEVESWDEEYKAAVVSVLEDYLVPPAKVKSDFDTAPCPVCGRGLTVDRKPTLHFRYQHPEIEAPDDWPPGS